MDRKQRVAANLFNAFVAVSIGPEGQTSILKTLGSDKAILNHVPSFCFPEAELTQPQYPPKSDSFTFTLTDSEGNRQFGFCRRTLPEWASSRVEPQWPLCFCIMTHYAWFEFFAQLLKRIEKALYSAENLAQEGVLLSEQQWDQLLAPFLNSLLACPLPKPGMPFALSGTLLCSNDDSYDSKAIKLKRPNDAKGIPLISNSMYARLFDCLSVGRIILLFTALLCERRIIIHSSNVQRLSSCVHASTALLYPFAWQHIFIPVLPKSMLDYCEAPMPFVVGVLSMHLPLVKRRSLEKVVFVDLDEGLITDAHFEEHASLLPGDKVRLLKRSLEEAVSGDLSGASATDSYKRIVHSFREFFLSIFGHYRKFLLPSQLEKFKGQLKFDKEAFIKSQPRSTKKFLGFFLHEQMFEQFIVEREKCANQSLNFEALGLFEKEVTVYQQQNMDGRSLGPLALTNNPKLTSDAANKWKDFKKGVQKKREEAKQMWNELMEEKEVGRGRRIGRRNNRENKTRPAASARMARAATMEPAAIRHNVYHPSHQQQVQVHGPPLASSTPSTPSPYGPLPPVPQRVAAYHSAPLPNNLSSAPPLLTSGPQYPPVYRPQVAYSTHQQQLPPQQRRQLPPLPTVPQQHQTGREREKEKDMGEYESRGYSNSHVHSRVQKWETQTQAPLSNNNHNNPRRSSLPIPPAPATIASSKPLPPVPASYLPPPSTSLSSSSESPIKLAAPPEAIGSRSHSRTNGSPGSQRQGGGRRGVELSALSFSDLHSIFSPTITRVTPRRAPSQRRLRNDQPTTRRQSDPTQVATHKPKNSKPLPPIQRSLSSSPPSPSPSLPSPPSPLQRSSSGSCSSEQQSICFDPFAPTTTNTVQPPLPTPPSFSNRSPSPPHSSHQYKQADYLNTPSSSSHLSPPSSLSHQQPLQSPQTQQSWLEEPIPQTHTQTPSSNYYYYNNNNYIPGQVYAPSPLPSPLDPLFDPRASYSPSYSSPSFSPPPSSASIEFDPFRDEPVLPSSSPSLSSGHVQATYVTSPPSSSSTSAFYNPFLL